MSAGARDPLIKGRQVAAAPEREGPPPLRPPGKPGRPFAHWTGRRPRRQRKSTEEKVLLLLGRHGQLSGADLRKRTRPSFYGRAQAAPDFETALDSLLRLGAVVVSTGPRGGKIYALAEGAAAPPPLGGKGRRHA